MQVQDEAQAGEITNFAAAIKSIQHLTMFKTLKNQLSLLWNQFQTCVNQKIEV